MSVGNIGQASYGYLVQSEMRAREQTQKQVDGQNSDQQQVRVQQQAQNADQRMQDKRAEQQQQTAQLTGVGSNLNISA